VLARYLSSSPSSLCFSLLLVLSVHRMCSQPFLILLLHLGSAVVLGVQRRAPQLLAPRYLPTSSFSSSSSSSSFTFSLPPSVPPSSLPLTPLQPSSLTSAMVYYLMLLETKLK